MVFQDPMTTLHPMLSIGCQLAEESRSDIRSAAEIRQGAGHGAARQVGVPNPSSATSRPHEFSGGMRQRR